MSVRNLSIQGRLYSLVATMVVFVGLLVGFLASSTRAVNENATAELGGLMMRGHQERLRTAVHALAVSLGAAAVGLPDQAARFNLIKRVTADIRFEEDRSGYFFIYQGTRAISIPAKPQLEGTDLDDLNGNMNRATARRP